MWQSNSSFSDEEKHISNLEKQILDLTKNIDEINREFARNKSNDQSVLVKEMLNMMQILNDRFEYELDKNSKFNLKFEKRLDNIQEQLIKLRHELDKAVQSQNEIFIRLEEELYQVEREARYAKSSAAISFVQYNEHDGYNVPVTVYDPEFLLKYYKPPQYQTPTTNTRSYNLPAGGTRLPDMTEIRNTYHRPSNLEN